MLFVVMVNVDREHPDRVAEPPATVFRLTHFVTVSPSIMLFVVKGSANMVYAMIIVVKTVTVIGH